MLSRLSSCPLTGVSDCGGKFGGALDVLANGGGMVEGELALDDGVPACWPAILRMKLMGALGLASARENRPDVATAEGGKGASG